MPGGRKRTIIERERDLAITSELYVKGMSDWQIANIVSKQYDFELTPRSIRNDKVELRKRWRESQLINFDEAKARELELIDRLIEACWKGWENSLREEGYEVIEEAKEDKLAGGEGDTPIPMQRYKKIIRRAERDGSVIWLEEIRKLSDQRAKIYGLYEAQKFQVDWRERMKENGVDDRVATSIMQQAMAVVDKAWENTEYIPDIYQTDTDDIVDENE